MNILFVTDNYHPAINGIVTQIDLLSHELERQGHTVYIVAPTFGKRDPKQENVYRLPSVVFPPRPLDRFCIPISSKITKIMEEKNIEVVHNHLFVSGFFGMKIARKNNIPIVATLHTPFTQYVRWSFPAFQGVSWPFLKVLYRWYFGKQDLVIGPSARATDELEAAGVKKSHLKIIHNGIVLKDFTHATDKLFRETFKIDKDVPIAISVGRLDPGKNVDLAIRATKITLASVPNLKLVIIGDGVFRKKLEELVVKEGIKDSVLFTGFQDRKMVASANKAATIALMPSDTDTLPTVTVEAMATGKPIVAIYDTAVLPLVTNDKNGFITKKDPEDFSNAMIKLLQDEKLQERFGNESFAVAQKFSVENTVNHLVEVYEELREKKKNA